MIHQLRESLNAPEPHRTHSRTQILRRRRRLHTEARLSRALMQTVVTTPAPGDGSLQLRQSRLARRSGDLHGDGHSSGAGLADAQRHRDVPRPVDKPGPGHCTRRSPGRGHVRGNFRDKRTASDRRHLRRHPRAREQFVNAARRARRTESRDRNAGRCEAVRRPGNAVGRPHGDCVAGRPRGWNADRYRHPQPRVIPFPEDQAEVRNRAH